MFIKNKILITIIIMVSISDSTVAQSCRAQIESLKGELSSLVLSADNLGIDGDCSSFAKARIEAMSAIEAVQKCKEASQIHPQLIRLKMALDKIQFDVNNKSQGEETRLDYYRFETLHQSFSNTLLQYETTLITNKLQKDIDTIVAKAKKDITDVITPLSSIPFKINQRTKTLIDSATDTLATRIYITSTTLNARLARIEKHLAFGPLYIGVNWFTQNGLGISGHYHFDINKDISPLAGPSIIYRWRKLVDNQSKIARDFGLLVSGGCSKRLSETSRLGALIDVSIINGETRLGGRLTAYNQFMAVGMGYSQYIGADVMLMIKIMSSN